MNRYNNEDISLNESATRNFLKDLFNSNRNDIDSLGFDSIFFSREETENGITYHFPDFEIDLQNKNLRDIVIKTDTKTPGLALVSVSEYHRLSDEDNPDAVCYHGVGWCLL